MLFSTEVNAPNIYYRLDLFIKIKAIKYSLEKFEESNLLNSRMFYQTRYVNHFRILRVLGAYK